MITDINDCVSVDTVYIKVKESDVWIPNVFNPNNPDPLNQSFIIRAKGIKDFYCAVYDRWGEKVFETNDITQGWNGTYKGTSLSSAVFIYYIRVIFYDGEKVEKKGDVTLIR
ncbi:MAG: gliding motility-associated C-terminal domain-containing protein [Bacteroidetes bacterium]|nr:gliding motility-associated C-terminal domain-containing protein [Bacteroidota bacterium]